MNTDPLNPGWRQIDLICTDQQAAEQMATTHLGPVLAFLEVTGVVFDWWFVRKNELWRLRVRPRIGSDDDLTASLTATIDTMIESGVILGSSATTYHPEIEAFGGQEAMYVAYALFHADSRQLLMQPLLNDIARRRERGLALAGRLMTAAGMGWQEQGHIWLQVAAHRSFDVGASDSPDMASDGLHLMSALTGAEAALLHSAPQWADAFQTAGTRLVDLQDRAKLTGDLRTVLVHHLLAMLNRHGMSNHDQHRLALAVAGAISDQPPTFKAPTNSSAADRPDSTDDARGTEAGGDRR